MSMSNTNKRVKEIHLKTRRKFSSKEKIRIVLDGLRGEVVSIFCWRRGVLGSFRNPVKQIPGVLSPF
jgi:hypothetical protein